MKTDAYNRAYPDRVHASVANTTALAAIPTEERVTGMLVLVTTGPELYTYNGSAFVRADANRVQVSSLNVTTTLLTTSGTSQTLDLVPDTPAAVQIIGVGIALATPFSGGGASSCVFDVGDAGDDNAFISNADVFASAVDGECSSMTAGIAPNKFFSAASTLQVKVTSDVNVDQLTAGDATVRVIYAVAG